MAERFTPTDLKKILSLRLKFTATDRAAGFFARASLARFFPARPTRFVGGRGEPLAMGSSARPSTPIRRALLQLFCSGRGVTNEGGY